MTILPSQRLSIGELFVSLAAGLMLFLLPNDARNQFELESVREGFVFIVSFLIVGVLLFIIKRYETVGSALLTMSVMTLLGFAVSTVNGFVTKGMDFWPVVSEYQIVSSFLLWIVPFLMVTVLRLLSGVSTDNNDLRRAFSRFLMLSMRALLLLYVLVIISRLVLPCMPNAEAERHIDLIPFSRIGECITGAHEGGAKYIIWHLIVFIPFTFHLSVMIPNLRVWHILIISAALGVTIEALQFLFNTGSVCLDDLVMYLVGAIAGLLIKYLINGLRSVLTSGQDREMLSYEYVPLRKPQTGEAETIESEE